MRSFSSATVHGRRSGAQQIGLGDDTNQFSVSLNHREAADPSSSALSRAPPSCPYRKAALDATIAVTSKPAPSSAVTVSLARPFLIRRSKTSNPLASNRSASHLARYSESFASMRKANWRSISSIKSQGCDREFRISAVDPGSETQPRALAGCWRIVSDRTARRRRQRAGSRHHALPARRDEFSRRDAAALLVIRTLRRLRSRIKSDPRQVTLS